MQQKRQRKNVMSGIKEEKFREELVAEVEKDFENRRAARLRLERQWELNMNFLIGNQYCDVNGRGEIVDEGSEYYWQKNDVFNHIAPIMESRAAKLSKVSPTLNVRPKTDDDSDARAASLAQKLLISAFEEENVMAAVRKVTVWSETCGTGFYKTVWNDKGGAIIGDYKEEPVFEGNVKVIPVSPFEIFPDNLFTENVEDCASIIEARAVTAAQIKEKYGVDVTGKRINVFGLKNGETGASSDGKDVLDDAVIVIERYERPTANFPKGRLITVADGKLLYYGELPYANDKYGGRTYPFVKQECVKVAGSFFGLSVIERLIPVQRAFNAVKNRKQEFLNRLCSGVMTVEDGSIDVDELAEEGLSPGKILVYRQGAKAPELMSGFSMPSEFNGEEERLVNEFVRISGVADVSSASANAHLTSGSALQILIEQDNERLVVHADTIRECILKVAKQILRLYNQFTVNLRAVKLADKEGKIRTYYVEKSAMESDDAYIENENELLFGNRQKKDAVFDMYKSGLLCDEEGKLRPAIKEKVLELLGYKELDYKKGIARLHDQKAQSENETIRKKGLAAEDIDDHRIHIDEHTRYILSEYDELGEKEKENLYAHLKQHKEMLEIKKGEEENDG